MAVTPVGQNRPQPPPQTETAKAPAQAQALDQKAGGGGSVGPAQAQRGAFGTQASDYGLKDTQPQAAQQNAFQQELARDKFDPGTGAADQAQAADAADSLDQQDSFSQAIGSLVQALNSVVDLVKNLLPPETGGADQTGATGGVG